MESLGKLPPFSPILNRLLATFGQEDVSFVKIAELIEKDTVLAGNVLQLVNSALYGRRATINSVRHAVSLLGMNKLRNAMLGMSVTRMWSQVRPPRGWSMANFNVHSVATAMLTDVISQSAPVDYPEGAFAAGLFHDLGCLLIAIALPEEYDQVTMLASGGRFSRSECETEALGFTHAELSAEALASWNLPEPIRAAVLYHHSPDLAPPCEEPISLSRAVDTANTYVNAAGYRIDTTGGNTSGQSRMDEAIARLKAMGLGESLPSMLETFAREFDEIRSMF